MPKPPNTKASHRRSIDTHGQSVTHTTFSVDTTDDYGDTTYTSSDTSITARFREVQTPLFTRDASGAEVEVDAELWVKDSVAVTDQGDDRPDEFTVNNVEYVVLTAENQDGGTIRVRMRRK